MARATTSRSQRQASQSQPQPTQTQRNGRRGRVVEENNGDGSEEGMDEDEDEERGDDDIVRKANDLVRLALFNEQRQLPLRRDEISKKVMGSKSRRFAEVYARAQEVLRKTFGMELAELHKTVEEETDVKKEKKDAVGMKKKAAPTGTKTYILRSVLDPQLIQLAAVPDAEILEIEQEDAAADEQHVREDDENASALTGAILAWQSGDSLGTVGLLYVILSLILVNGRALPDNDLRTYLRRLRLQPTAPVPLTNRSTHSGLTVDQFLSLSIRQGYLDKLRVGEAKGAKKRGRAAAAATQGGSAEEIAWEWRWGPRAMSEVGEADIARFVSEFMVERAKAEAGEDEEEDGQQTQKARETMMKGVERAAGGELLEIR